MTTIQVRGITLKRSRNEKSEFITLATAGISAPDLGFSVAGVLLTWSELEGYRAIGPTSYAGGVRWPRSGKFAALVLDALLAAYRALGGEEPVPPVRRDHVTGKPIGPDVFDGLERLDIADEMPANALELAEGAVERAQRHAGDDTEGLRRLLGVDAIEETMARAGL